MDLEQFDKAVHGLASQLGQDWTATTDDRECRRSIGRGQLRRKDGAALHLMERWKERRMIRVSCVWPRFHQTVFDPKACSLVESGTKDLEMNFRADRVCAEVQRRVLCDYLTLLPLCVEYRDNQVAAFRSLLGEVEELADEGKLRRHSAEPRFGEELALSQYDSDGVSSSYRVSPWSRSARIELTSVPIPLAKKIAKLVENHNATG